MILNLLSEEAQEQPEIVQAISDAIEENAPDLAENVSGLSKMISEIWTAFVAKIPTIIFAIIILILGILLSKLVVKLMTKALDRSKLDLTVNRFLRSIVKIALYVLVVTVVLTLLGVPTTSIITVIGTAGVAIGLALQNSLSNIAGGFLILFAKPFKVGSYISTNGVEGTVESINILYTKLLTIDNKAVFIPNGSAANAVCVNFNDHELRRVDQVFSISYDDDYEKAEQAIRTALSKIPEILTAESLKPFTAMSAHSASSIDITVRAWCRTENYWTVYFAMIKNVRDAFIKSGIEIPYQQLDVHLKQK